MIDGDVLDMLKAKAAESEVGYQTMMNEILREYFGAKEKISNRVVMARISSIAKELKALEMKVKKPA